MEIYARSDIGKVRSSNQDCYDFGTLSSDFAWALVCDGMGGISFGDVASCMARNTVKDILNKKFSDKLDNYDEQYLKDLLLSSLEVANLNIFEKSKEKNFGNMGTTIVLAVILKDSLCIAHVGDSRAYIVSEKCVKQLTNDHSVVQEMVKSGKITSAQAKNSAQKNIITRALGVEKTVDVDYKKFTLDDGDSVLLCTDGLTNYVDEENLHSLFLSHKNQEYIDTLVNLANNLGGKDNITALLISK